MPSRPWGDVVRGEWDGEEALRQNLLGTGKWPDPLGAGKEWGALW